MLFGGAPAVFLDFLCTEAENPKAVARTVLR